MFVSDGSLGADKIDLKGAVGKWFNTVYDDYFERLYRYAFSITKNKEHAEDVVADVFLNIWKNKQDHHNIQELSSYLYVSVKHLAIRQTSKNPSNFTYSTYDEALQISDVVNPENIMEGKELEAVIEEVLEGLSPHAKLVYDMAKTKGMKSREIAEELGVSERTVEAHLYQVIKKLKDQLRCRFSFIDARHRFLG